MELDWIIYVTAGIAFLAIALLCVRLYSFFGSLSRNINGVSTEVQKTVESLNGQINGIQDQVNQIVTNVAGISGQVEQTLDRVNSQLVEVNGIVEGIKEITGDAERMTEDAADVIHETRNVVISLMQLEQNVQRKVQMPVVEMLSVFSALGRGIRVFRKRMGGEGSTIRSVATEAADEIDDDSQYYSAPAASEYQPPAGVPSGA
jgi:uncharacterized protein YoxC